MTTLNPSIKFAHSVFLVTEIYVLLVAETIVLLVTKNSALLFTDYNLVLQVGILWFHVLISMVIVRHLDILQVTFVCKAVVIVLADNDMIEYFNVHSSGRGSDFLSQVLVRFVRL